MGNNKENIHQVDQYFCKLWCDDYAKNILPSYFKEE